MPITPRDLERWMSSSPWQKAGDLTGLEGGERLRWRFASFLAVKHPGVLQAYLAQRDIGPFEVELLMREALAEVTRTRLRGVLQQPEVYELLSEWSRHDEDAYELLNQLRPQ